MPYSEADLVANVFSYREQSHLHVNQKQENNETADSQRTDVPNQGNLTSEAAENEIVTGSDETQVNITAKSNSQNESQEIGQGNSSEKIAGVVINETASRETVSSSTLPSTTTTTSRTPAPNSTPIPSSSTLPASPSPPPTASSRAIESGFSRPKHKPPPNQPLSRDKRFDPITWAVIFGITALVAGTGAGIGIG